MQSTNSARPMARTAAPEPESTSQQERDEQRREAQRALQRSLESRW